ncbi:EpsG family protein [Endozoicomonas sp. 2B-B]
MLDYYFLVFYSTLIALISPFLNKKDLQTCFYLFLCLILLFTAFRYFAGADYEAYINIYEASRLNVLEFDFFDRYGMEPLYSIANSIFNTLGMPGFLFLALLAAISISSKGYIFNKLSLNPVVSLFVYFSLVYISSEFIQIRWALALSIIFAGFYFYNLKRYFVSFLLLFLASFIHIFSFLVLLLVIANKAIFERCNTGVRFWTLLGLSLLFSILIDLVYVVNWLQAFAGESYLKYKVLGYTNNFKEAASNLFVFKYIFFGLTVLFFKIKYDDLNRNAMTSLFFTFLCVFFILLDIPMLASRLSLIIDFLFSIIVINNAARFKFYNSLIVNVTIVFISSGYWCYNIFVSFLAGNIFPYKTWLY